MPVALAEKLANSRSKDDLSTRDKLLDAAEKLFAEGGFYGSTTRGIAKQAGMPLGLMSYYYKTKSDLYSAVIMRRAEEHAAAIQQSINTAQQRAGDQPISVSELAKAYFRPLAERSLHGGAGWRSYIQLLSQAANSPRREPYKESVEALYSPVAHQVVELMKEQFPEAKEENIYWAFYMLTSSIIHILVESGSIDKFSGGTCRSSDLETIMEKIGPYFEAGLARLAEQ